MLFCLDAATEKKVLENSVRIYLICKTSFRRNIFENLVSQFRENN